MAASTKQRPPAAARGRSPKHVACGDEIQEWRLLAAVAGDRDERAFESLYARHYQSVVRAAFGVCRDAATAEDIAQQAFTALWMQAGELVDKRLRVEPWLAMVARHGALDARGREAPSQSLTDCARLPCVASAEVAVVEALLCEQRRGAFAALTDVQNRAIELVHVEGLSIARAARTAGVSEMTIRTRLRRAAGQLRAHVAFAAR